MGRMSFNSSMRKYKDLDSFKPIPETKTVTTLKEGIDYNCKVFEMTKSINDIVGEEAKLITQQFPLKNNTVTFYLNPDTNEILVDSVDYCEQDSRLLIKLLNIPDGFKFKNISVLTTRPTYGIFVVLSKSDSQHGNFMKAIKLNDIINIKDDNRICHGY